MALLDNLSVVLVNTRFPENVGMAARACVNMGCADLRLVAPERWDRGKALPLATAQGRELLDRLTIHASLSEAIASSGLVLGATARTGGWRQGMLSPKAMAAEAVAALARQERVSLVLGPEDRGLANTDTALCHRLVTIPTDAAARSLNLAQATLLLLWECAEATRAAADAHRAAQGHARAGTDGGERRVMAAEQERLMAAFKDMLLRLDCLHGDNPDYFLLPWRRLFGRAGLKRHEYDALMGLCRQVRRKLD